MTYHAFLADPRAAVARAHAFLGVDPALRRTSTPLAYKRPSELPICRKVANWAEACLAFGDCADTAWMLDDPHAGCVCNHAGCAPPTMGRRSAAPLRHKAP